MAAMLGLTGGGIAMGIALEDFAAAVAGGSIRTIDLTQTLSPETPTLVLPPEFGQCAGFSQEEISRYDERGVAWYWNNFTVGEHTGTHFDAPIHWVSGKDLPDNALDTIDPRAFIAPAVVIDCSAEAAADPDFTLTVAVVEAWEAKHGKIPPRSWILFRTDWSKRAGEAYTNRGPDGAHTPGPDPDAVKFLIDERDAHGFGVETIGTDSGQAHRFDPPYPAHTFFHGAGRYGLQCLTNLDLLPPKGAVIVATPLKIAGGSGSPLRVLALIET
jgi:kynurenine formamidase